MSAIIVMIHVIACIALIMIVLLQTGKGADMGVAFGGGSSQTLFGTTGASTFLTKATTIMAIVFMLTSLSLAYIWGQRKADSVMTDYKPVVQKQAAGANENENTAQTATPGENLPAAESSSQKTSDVAGDTQVTEQVEIPPVEPKDSAQENKSNTE